jgi:hypothetical protein
MFLMEDSGERRIDRQSVDNRGQRALEMGVSRGFR